MFTLYKASAGSGKTSRLVVEYLSLCLPQPEKFSHVLALTFTNNATAEMKSRIVETLAHLAFDKNITDSSQVYHIYNQIVAKIAKHLQNEEQSDFIQIHAKQLLETILFNYDRFSISTIDSFFQRVLRAFSLEFGLNSQYVLEIEYDDFFRETITVLLNRISEKNPELTKRVFDLVHNIMLEKGKWKIEREIFVLLADILKEQYHFTLKEIQESDNKNFEQAKKIVNEESFRLKAQEKKFISKTEKKSEAYIELQEKIIEIEFFRKNLFQFSLLFDLKIIMDEIKAQDNIFFLSETNALINEKISKENDVPFIYEKIGNQYSYFFIDEFQDTSKLQWENMLPLIKNALSGNNKFNEQGRVFLFGDMKQAIYRFRNGDAEMFRKLSDINGYRDVVLPYAKQNIDYNVNLLDTNYRSAKKVVEFNNEFFNYLTDEGGHFCVAKDYYEDVKQKIKPSAEEGMVTVRFQEDDDMQNFQEFVLDALFETVFDVLQRGYTCKDIAVLVGNNDLSISLGAFLVSNNLPIISVESLKLSVSPQVIVTVATLKYLISTEDNVSKLAIVLFLTKQHNLSLSDYIKYVQSDELFQKLLKDFNINLDIENLNSLPLFTLINEIFGIYSLPVSNPFLTRLLDETERFIEKRNGTVSLFLEWWEVTGREISLSSPKGFDAITVSTIHKSKGLEYPVVIFPCSRYGNTKTKPDIFVKDNITGLEYDWVTLSSKATPERYQHKYKDESNKTLIDQLNKLYVVHTRAKKELHIITEKRNAKGGNYSKFLAEFCEKYEVEQLSVRRLDDKMIRRLDDKMIRRLDDTSLCNHHIITSSNHLITPRTSYGISIHNYLSTLTSFPQNKEEIDWAVQNMDEIYKDALARFFNKILNDPSLSPYFAPNVKVLNETSILFPDGNLLRPDRVVFMEDRVVVIDYKTGDANASHKEQIEQYCEAIRNMGYGEVEGRILYM